MRMKQEKLDVVLVSDEVASGYVVYIGLISFIQVQVQYATIITIYMRRKMWRKIPN